MAEVRVGSEDRAFELLQEAIAGKFDGQEVDLVFDNWPVIEIRLTGDGYDSTITADVAEALIEIQNAMNRSYARCVHGRGNARTLTADERREIRFKAKVEKGSSFIKIDLGEYAATLTQALVGKMDPAHLVITVIGIAAVAGATVAYRAFLKHRSEDKKLDVEAQKAIALSAQETRRLEVMAQAIAVEPKLGHSKDDFDDARREVLRSVGDARELSVNGVSLTRDVATVIATTPRSASEDVQLNGNYVITAIIWDQGDDVKLTLQSTEFGTFSASLSQVNLQRGHRDILQSAEWDRKTIYLSINATRLRGEVTNARIVAVAWPPEARGKS